MILLVLGCVQSYSVDVRAQPSPDCSIDLPPGRTEASLQRLAESCDLQLLYPAGILDNSNSDALSGVFTPDQALTLLLAETELIFRIDNQTIAIRRPEADLPEEDEEEEGGIDIPRTGGELAMREEIVVTAFKRQLDMRQVVGTITMSPTIELKEQGIVESLDLDQHVPGLEMGINALGNGAVSIRGVGINEAADFDNVPNSVAIHVDEIYLSSPAMNSFLMFDIARIEVLSGPQGTLYGRNSTSGVINYISRKPRIFESGQIKFDYSRFGLATTEASYNKPLSDSLYGRVAAIHQSGGGNYNTPSGRTLNEVDRGGVRGIVRWEPDSPFQAELIYQNSWDQSDGHPATPFGEVELSSNDPRYCENQYFPAREECGTGFGPIESSRDYWTVDPTVEPRVDARLNSVIGRVQWDGPLFSVTAIGGIQNFSKRSQADRDAMKFLRIQEFRNTEIDQWSSEIRLYSRNPEHWNWLVGIYASSSQMQINRTFQNSVGQETHFNSRPDEWSSSVFMHNLIPVSDGIEIIVGARYTHEQKELFAESVIIPAGMGVPFSQVSGLGDIGNYAWLPDGGVTRRNSWSNLSGELGVNWRILPQVSLYSTVSNGFKSGGYSGSFTIRTNPPSDEDRFQPYDPEILVQTELGLRSQWREGDIHTDLALFHIRLEDKVEQILVESPNSLTGLATNFVNAAEARIYGVEFDFRWQITERLSLISSSVWMDAEYEKFLIDPRDPDNQMSPENNRRGFRLPQAPKFSSVLNVTYQIPLESGQRLRFYGDVEYTSSQFFNSRNVKSVAQPDYTIWNGRFSWFSSDGRTEVGTYIRNITNQKYAIYGTDSVDGVNLLYFGRQRTAGIHLRYLF